MILAVYLVVIVDANPSCDGTSDCANPARANNASSDRNGPGNGNSVLPRPLSCGLDGISCGLGGRLDFGPVRFAVYVEAIDGVVGVAVVGGVASEDGVVAGEGGGCGVVEAGSHEGESGGGEGSFFGAEPSVAGSVGGGAADA